jgi:resuscitation-promoting factor RpfA
MTWQLTPETAGILQRTLLVIAVGAALWYCARIALALFLLACERRRPGSADWAVRCAPAGLRPLIRRAVVSGILGASLTGTAAWAAPPTDCWTGPGDVVVLDRAADCATAPAVTTTLAPAPADQAPATTPKSTNRYEVQPGDSLWSITGALLSTSDPTAVSAAWPTLWGANRDLIGQEPGLIKPGLELTVPAGFVR